jgi:sec-independent protein translocase protein TatB
VPVFGIGTSELLVVAVLALLLFPPKELPKILRGLTQLWGTLRRTADEFKDAILQEEAMQDLKDAVDGTKAQLRDVEGAARRELMKARMEARRAENKLLKVSRERERIEREAAAKEQAEGGGAIDGPKPEGAPSPGAAAASPAAASSADASALAASPVVASPAVAASRPVGASSAVSPAPAHTVAAGSSVAAAAQGTDDDAANQGAA